MRKQVTLCLVLSSLLCVTTTSFAKEPKNLSLVKESLVKYHDSGEYQKDQAKVIDQAMKYLKARLDSEKKSNTTQKLALVLDIDETSLSNYPDMFAMSFGGTYQQICDAMAMAKDPAIDPTLELYRYAKANHIAVFFITGRTEKYRSITEQNLTQTGYTDWDGLVFKPEDYHEKTVSIYKSEQRENIEKQGYDIALNIGDQQSDLAGKHADKSFKLPNPYYFIP